VILKFLIICAAFIPFILFIYFRYKKVNIVFACIVQYFFAAVCIVFGASLALYIQGQADLIHMYLLMAFFTGAFLYMRPLGSFALFLLTYLYFLLMLPQHVAGYEARTVIIANTAASNVAAWIMSNVLWRAKIMVFKNKKLLFMQNNRLKEINKKDSMTELYNHEASLMILEKELRRSDEFDLPLSIIVADIDDFKRINDSFGHLYGDHAIKEVANTIYTTSRKTDYVGRYGGEEFIIIMPNTNLKAAHSHAQRLKENLAKAAIDENVKITLSGGVSQYCGEKLNELIRITDQKLYVAKNTGKNRFETELSEPAKTIAGKPGLEPFAK
jgi:diguanylate cyclase (GGDEF)-like protein